jgi:hypothetical protein
LKIIANENNGYLRIFNSLAKVLPVLQGSKSENYRHGQGVKAKQKNIDMGR